MRMLSEEMRAITRFAIPRDGVLNFNVKVIAIGR